nr:MAG TPA: Protein of unknown function (DUF1492) [Caudoviricetes sp.]
MVFIERTAREYFQRVRQLRAEMDSLSEELKLLESMKGQLRAVDYSAVSVSGGRRKDIGDLVVNIDEVQGRLNMKIGEYFTMYIDATQMIGEVIKDDTIKRALRLYYLVGMTANDIRDKLITGKTLNERTVRNYIKNGLEQVDKFIEIHGHM